MDRSSEHRYGAILWEGGAEIDEAIRFVVACDERDWAVYLVESNCGPGEQWAVVDLVTMQIAARGCGSPAAVAGPDGAAETDAGAAGGRLDSILAAASLGGIDPWR